MKKPEKLLKILMFIPMFVVIFASTLIGAVLSIILLSHQYLKYGAEVALYDKIVNPDTLRSQATKTNKLIDLLEEALEEEVI
jgi:hypothetical protein